MIAFYNPSVVEPDKKLGLPGKNCYQAKFSTVEIVKLSSLKLEKVRINPIWATSLFEVKFIPG